MKNSIVTEELLLRCFSVCGPEVFAVKCAGIECSAEVRAYHAGRLSVYTDLLALFKYETGGPPRYELRQDQTTVPFKPTTTVDTPLSHGDRGA